MSTTIRRIRPLPLQRPNINTTTTNNNVIQKSSQHSRRLNTRTRLVQRLMNIQHVQILPMRQLSRQATNFNNAMIRNMRMQRRHITRARHIRRHNTRIAIRIPQLLTKRQQIKQVRSISQTRHTRLMPTNLRLFITMTRRITTSIITPPTVPSIKDNNNRLQLRNRQFPNRSHISKRTSQMTIKTKTNMPKRNRQPITATP